MIPFEQKKRHHSFKIKTGEAAEAGKAGQAVQAGWARWASPASRDGTCAILTVVHRYIKQSKIIQDLVRSYKIIKII